MDHDPFGKVHIWVHAIVDFQIMVDGNIICSCGEIFYSDLHLQFYTTDDLSSSQWYVEDDVAYTGDWASFFSNTSYGDADIVAKFQEKKDSDKWSWAKRTMCHVEQVKSSEHPESVP